MKKIYLIVMMCVASFLAGCAAFGGNGGMNTIAGPNDAVVDSQGRVIVAPRKYEVTAEEENKYQTLDSQISRHRNRNDIAPTAQTKYKQTHNPAADQLSGRYNEGNAGTNANPSQPD